MTRKKRHYPDRRPDSQGSRDYPVGHVLGAGAELERVYWRMSAFALPGTAFKYSGDPPTLSAAPKERSCGGKRIVNRSFISAVRPQ
jgi:hypothetical protein